MSVNLAVFQVRVAVPGDRRTLADAKHKIEEKLAQISQIEGVTVLREEHTPMLICTAPGMTQ